jgi:hypothetical protein
MFIFASFDAIWTRFGGAMVKTSLLVWELGKSGPLGGVAHSVVDYVSIDFTSKYLDNFNTI